MSKEIDLLKNGFKYLKQDSSRVCFNGWISKDEIPKSAMPIKDKDSPDNSFEVIHTSYWDKSDYWGKVYLPYSETEHMEFEVGA